MRIYWNTVFVKRNISAFDPAFQWNGDFGEWRRLTYDDRNVWKERWKRFVCCSRFVASKFLSETVNIIES